MTQDSQIPPVFGDLRARVGEGPPEVGKQRADQRPPHRLALDGQLRQAGHLCLAQLPDQTAQEPAVARAVSPGPLLQPVKHLHHDQRGQTAQVDLAGNRERLGRPVPPALIKRRDGPAGSLPPARVHRAVSLLPAVTCPPGPQARQYRALAAAQHRQWRLLPGRTWPGTGPAAVPPDEPVPSRGRQHPGHRVPSGPGQEPRIQQGGEPDHGRLGDDTARTQHHRRGRPRRDVRGGTQRAASRTRRGHRVTPASSRGLGTASTAARSRAGSGWV